MSLEDLSEEELKKRKLISEIDELHKPFLKRILVQPTFWAFLIALIAAIFSWQSGLFETESKILELKTMQLNLRKDTLSKQIDNLIIQKKQLTQKVDSFKTIIVAVKKEKGTIEEKIQKLASTDAIYSGYTE